MMDSNKYCRKCFLLVIILTIIFSTILGKRLSNSTPQTNQKTNYDHVLQKSFSGDSINDGGQAKVLIVYVYARTHSQAYGNLKYFIDHAVRENDGADYYFILQNVNNKTVNESELPLLPKGNAHYIQHENVCYDFGTIGWFLNTYTVGNPWINQSSMIDQEKKINITHYKHFVFINSSVRGPFYPPYFLKFLSDYKEEFEKSFYWYYVFTKRINKKVKLVGSTISCIPVPHVQTFIFAIDFIGLTILLKPPNDIFGCYTVQIHVSFNSEVPASTRILQAGYMIDCVLTKYQQIDFTLPHNQLCNQHKNPYLDNNLDETPLLPYEAVFIKYSDLPFLQVSKRIGELHERWMEDTKNPNRTVW